MHTYRRSPRRAQSTIDLLTFHEGENVEIANCRIHRIARPLGIRNIRPGFSVKKVVCDLFMFVKCLRMVRQNRYDLIHAVEEAAFIAAAMQRLAGIPYVYDMDSSLAEQLVDVERRVRDRGLYLVGDDIARHVDGTVHKFEEWGLPIMRDPKTGRYQREGKWQIMIHGESYKPIVAEAAPRWKLTVLTPNSRSNAADRTCCPVCCCM